MRTLHKPKPLGVNFAREERQGLLRRISRQLAAAVFWCVAVVAMAPSLQAQQPWVGAGNGYVITVDDARLLDEVQRRAALYFVEQSDAVTGLTRDRAANNGAFSHAPSSVAATGFALTAWCIADQRGWLRTGEVRRLAVR